MTGVLYRQTFRMPASPPEGRAGGATQALLGCLQEAAGRDAEARGAGMGLLRERGLAWVLLRLAMDVESRPWPTEDVTVATWPTRFGGATAERDFAVESARGGRVAVASSRWAVFDLRTRRAVRVPEFIRALEVPPTPPALPFSPLPDANPSANRLGEQTVEVGPSDLDSLGHANNARYLEWSLAALPAGFTDERAIAHLDLTFKREALVGDRLRSLAFLVGEDAVRHEIWKPDEREPCASILTSWRTVPRPAATSMEWVET